MVDRGSTDEADLSGGDLTEIEGIFLGRVDVVITARGVWSGRCLEGLLKVSIALEISCCWPGTDIGRWDSISVPSPSSASRSVSLIPLTCIPPSIAVKLLVTASTSSSPAWSTMSSRRVRWGQWRGIAHDGSVISRNVDIRQYHNLEVIRLKRGNVVARHSLSFGEYQRRGNDVEQRAEDC